MTMQLHTITQVWLRLAKRRASGGPWRKVCGIGLLSGGLVFPILAGASQCFADEPRPVRQIESEDGVIELTNAKRATPAMEMGHTKVSPVLTAEPAALAQTKLALTPVPQADGTWSAGWMLVPAVLVALAGGWSLRRRAHRMPKRVVADASERVGGLAEALSALTPRERPSGVERQWVSQAPPHRRSGS
jgi:hypothetical protein